MSTLLEELKSWGCDVDGAMERFIDDEGLYRTCLDSVMADKNFEGLLDALNRHDVSAAFEYAHTLKGVLSSMGLTPMYDIVVRIVEPLRAGSDENLLPVCDELIQAKKMLGKLIEAG